MTSFYDKNRQDVIKEARNRVYNIAKDYDDVISHHAGCAYCEHRCKHYEKVRSYLNEKVSVERVLENLAGKGFSEVSLNAFVHSNLMKPANLTDPMEEICLLGTLLAEKKDLNDGQRQKYIAGYLRYKHNH